MQESFRLGAIRGIPVGVHWSVVLIFALVFLALATGLLPVFAPGYTPAAYAAIAFATAAAFFLSVLAHEAGHALLARTRGVQVEGITLWLLGGVARFTTLPASPRDDLQIAGVGPLISALLSVGFGAVAGLLVLGGAAPLLSAGVGWLALINLALALFNMIPAAPLDGGRVLRALIWRRTGDRALASRRAARGGRFFGLALIAIGLLEVAFGMLAGLWLALVGWFLVSAARGEETASWLTDLTVGEAMTADPVVAPDWLTVQAFLDDYVFAHPFSTFPLRDFGGSLSGLVTLGALKRIPAEQRTSVQVRAVAVPIAEIPTAQPGEDLTAVAARLAQGPARRALVFDGEDLVGMLGPADLTRMIERAPLRTRGPDPQPQSHPSERDRPDDSGGVTP